MKLQALAYALIFLALISTAHGGVSGEEELKVTVTVEKSHTSLGELIVVYGKVTYANGTAVPMAEVSVQVDGPNGGTVRIAFLYSDLNGVFSDRCQLKRDAPEGDYMIYVTAIKEGYQGHKSFSFTIKTESQPSTSLEFYLLPLGGTILAALITTSLWSMRRRARRRMLESLEPTEDMDYMAAARASARIEELKAQRKIDEKTYNRLKREYEQRLKELSENP